VRGRLGVAFDRIMPYVTGGLAVGAFQSVLTSGGGSAEARKSTRLGWTLGGGVEYAFSDDWSVKAEYRYSDYGRINMATYQAMPGNQFSTRLTDNEGRIGFTYHWRGWGGGPVVAKY
jgi:outer membrane immunogenic protein